MSAKAAPTCPNCHAPLPLAGTARVIKCEYCGRDVMREQTGPPAGPIRVQLPPQHSPPIQAHVSRVKWMIIAFTALPIVIAAITMSQVMKRANQAQKTHGGSGPGGGGHVPKGEHMQWDGSATPVPVDINNDGVEDFIGRYRLLEKGDDHSYVGAFDGKTLDRIWKSAALGTENRSVMYAVAGKRALVSDASNFVYTLELTTGNELRSTKLTDKIERFCPNPEDASKVWIEVTDEHHVMLDMATGETKATDRPGWCPGDLALSGGSSDCWRANFHRSRRANARCVSEKKAPRMKGFAAEHVLEDGGKRVAIGHKNPGTRTPMVVGFEGSGKKGKVTWSRNLADDAYETSLEITDLADDRVLILYQTKESGWHFIALEVATGNTIFDVAIPRSDTGSGPDTMKVTASRVYVPHWTWLDVFETASGEHLGTVGKW